MAIWAAYAAQTLSGSRSMFIAVWPMSFGDLSHPYAKIPDGGALVWQRADFAIYALATKLAHPP